LRLAVLVDQAKEAECWNTQYKACNRNFACPIMIGQPSCWPPDERSTGDGDEGCSCIGGVPIKKLLDPKSENCTNPCGDAIAISFIITVES
jgi:hypothetical protein